MSRFVLTVLIDPNVPERREILYWQRVTHDFCTKENLDIAVLFRIFSPAETLTLVYGPLIQPMERRHVIVKF